MSPVIGTIANASARGFGLFTSSSGPLYWVAGGLGSGYGNHVQTAAKETWIASYGTTYQFSPDGSVNWAIAHGGLGSTYSMSADDAGNSYIGGSKKMAKYDINGNVVWLRQFTNNGSSTYGTFTHTDGTTYICGYENIGSSQYGFIARVNANGTLAWWVRANTPSDLQDVVYDPVNNAVYACGVRQENTSTYGGCAVKLDASTGAVAWTKNFDQPGQYCFGFGVATDLQGNAYFSGFSGSPRNNFVFKFTTGGSYVWGKQQYSGSAGYASNDYGRIDCSGSNNLYIMNYSEMFLKFDTSGNQVFSRRLNDKHGFLDITVGSDDTVVMMGTDYVVKVRGDGGGLGTWPGGIFSAPSITWGNISSFNPINYSNGSYSYSNTGYTATAGTWSVAVTYPSIQAAALGA